MANYKRKCELHNFSQDVDLVDSAESALKLAEITRSHGVIIDAGLKFKGQKVQLKTEIAKELKRHSFIFIGQADMLPAVWNRAQGALKFRDR